jgi:hypothetical protein
MKSNPRITNAYETTQNLHWIDLFYLQAGDRRCFTGKAT